MARTRFADRHPYWFVAILEAVMIGVYLVAGTVAHFTNLSNYGLYGVASLILSLVAAVLLTVLGWWRVIGFRVPNRPRDLWYFLLPLLPVVVTLSMGVEVPRARLLIELLAIALLIGFAEETIFRGLMLTALKTRGLWQAAMITALLFGVSHALNILSGKSALETAAQICYAVAFGFAFAALVLNKGIVWPLVIVHALIDFITFMQRPGVTLPPGWNLLIVVSLTIIFTAYGVVLMRQTREAQVQAVHVSH